MLTCTYKDANVYEYLKSRFTLWSIGAVTKHLSFVLYDYSAIIPYECGSPNF